jgi:hypothetical protein
MYSMIYWKLKIINIKLIINQINIFFDNYKNSKF